MPNAPTINSGLSMDEFSSNGRPTRRFTHCELHTNLDSGNQGRFQYFGACLQWHKPYIYRPQTKLRKGNVFTGVCQGSCPRCGVSQHTLGQTPPSLTRQPPDGHCSGRYASYWNAFLFVIFFETLYEIWFADPDDSTFEYTTTRIRKRRPLKIRY